MIRSLLSLEAPEMAPLTKAGLSSEFRCVIDIHERTGGTVDVRWRDRRAGGIQVRLDGGPWIGCLSASKAMARMRAGRLAACAA